MFYNKNKVDKAENKIDDLQTNRINKLMNFSFTIFAKDKKIRNQAMVECKF